MQTSGRPPQLVHSLEEDLPGLHWLLADQWVLLGMEDHQWVGLEDLWEALQEAQEDLQDQCFRQDIDLMVQDQVDPREAQIVGVHQVVDPQVHLEMLRGKTEVIHSGDW